MNSIRKAIIPVAGLGTRFLPATKVIPKELLPIVDKPAIQYLIEEIIASGIQEIILIMGRGKEKILDYFDRAPELEFSLEKNKKIELLKTIQKLSQMAHFVTVWQSEPLGLGHAVLCAEEVINPEENFLVCLPDDLIDSHTPVTLQLLQQFEKVKSPLLAVQKVPIKQSFQYGIVKPLPFQKKLWQVQNLVEKPLPQLAPSNLAVVGRYILNAQIFSDLKKIKKKVGQEIQLTDALSAWAKKNKLFAYEFEGKRYDTGDKLGFLKANLAYGFKRKEFKSQLKPFIKELLNEK